MIFALLLCDSTIVFLSLHGQNGLMNTQDLNQYISHKLFDAISMSVQLLAGALKTLSRG